MYVARFSYSIKPVDRERALALSIAATTAQTESAAS
jgi:hypothetical protein